MVTNPYCRPSSKPECFEHWLQQKAYLLDYRMLKLDQSYRSLDFLNNRIRHAEKEILNRTAALFNADAEGILNAPYSNV